MRFIFKTSYDQDIRLAQHGGHVFWYGLLMLLLVTAPGWLEEYWLAQLTFVLIYSIMGLGLMGRGMAGRLLEAGHELIVHNRTAAAGEPLRARLQRGLRIVFGDV